MGTTLTGLEASRTVREIEPNDAAERLRRREATLLDVREPDEHARERIASARLVPLSSFDAASIVASGGKDGSIVLHCRSGRRSADAARMLIAAGASPERVLSMRGGIEGWKAAGGPVEVDRRVSRLSVMRQVQLTIGAFVLAGAALAWFVHPAFVAIPAFFGAGLLFAGASGTCGLALVLERMPWNRVPAPTACAAPTAGGGR